MFKINNKSIVLILGILAISASGMAFSPATASAQTGYNYSFSTYSAPVATPKAQKAPELNPAPIINSISPNASNKGMGTKTITITGKGFIPSSVARMNGLDRHTVFIDSSRLLIKLVDGDLYRDDSFFISVFNKGPGGGYSNAVVFTMAKPAMPTGSAKNTGAYSGGGAPIASDSPDTFREIPMSPEQQFSNLASNAIFGGDGFMPSGLIQWVMFAIIVLLIVILARKVFGAQDKYHSTPLKHS